MTGNVIFSVSTQMEMEGRQLKALKPDKNGWFKGIPPTMPKIAMLERLMRIERKNVSHRISRVYGKNGDDGLIIVYGDVKPFGPMGQYLKEEFEDPTMDAAFSLRSACVKYGQDGGIIKKKMLSLVTFDAVDGPGYLKASKRWVDASIGNEGLSTQLSASLEGYDKEIEVTQKDVKEAQEHLLAAGVESCVVTSQRVLDAFCCDKVIIKDRVIGKLGKGNFTDGNKPVSVFDLCFNS